MPLMDESTPLGAQIARDHRRAERLASTSFPKPEHTRILTVANQKGGVGKTTTTVNIAASLASHGLEVLVVDIDPQGNASTALSIDHSVGVDGIYEVLIDDYDIADVVKQSPEFESLTCVPATIDLAGAEIDLVSKVAREMRLHRALTKYLEARDAAGRRVDYVLIDCPPSLGLLTVNAFVAAQEVFIPIQCEYYALEGVSQLLKSIQMIQEHLNPELWISTVLLTMYDGRTRLSAQVAEEVRTHFAHQVLDTVIPRSVRISEAPSYGKTVIAYEPNSSGALSYREAAEEISVRGVRNG
ncbi:ParA family protein [Brevibacterium yomogidense]|uniref:ParA family protein n=1 Tax=Brevibacterium yomogidense TaxID=946573 RepID=UPI0018DFB5D0|nr:AAA family ATPase [Brevibacterium yomogidense]